MGWNLHKRRDRDMTNQEREDQDQLEYIARWNRRKKYRKCILRIIRYYLSECIRLIRCYVKGCGIE